LIDLIIALILLYTKPEYAKGQIFTSKIMRYKSSPIPVRPSCGMSQNTRAALTLKILFMFNNK